MRILQFGVTFVLALSACPISSGYRAPPRQLTQAEQNEQCRDACSDNRRGCQSDVTNGAMLNAAAPGFKPPQRDCAAEYRDCMSFCSY